MTRLLMSGARHVAAGTTATLLLTTNALGAATTVREPAWGLPHFYADTDIELARENGREIAKDRLGQLILLSRAGRGTLAQAFGALDPSFVDVDIETRIGGYTSSELNSMFTHLPPATQALLLAYCDGVNDTIDAIYDGEEDEPLEISVLRHSILNLDNDLFGNATNVSDQVDPYYKAPGGADPQRPNGGYQFTPEMAMSIAVLQVRNFGLNTFEEQNRLSELIKLQDALGMSSGEEVWRDLNFLNDPLAPISVPDATTPGYGGPLANVLDLRDAVAGIDKVDAERARRWAGKDWKASAEEIKARASLREETLKRWSAWPKLGSYAWLIAANRSATGNPWLGGFPQTGIQTPSLMHYAENRSGEGIMGNGMEFVGGPYILIGHTDSVAFTTTTAQLRIIDTFFEQVIGENTDNVRYNDEGTPAQMKKRTEKILTGGASFRNVVFWRTHERGGNGGSRPVLDFVGDAEGTAEGGTATTLVDNQATFAAALIGGHVLITDGTGAGQIRAISGASGTTLTVATPFTTAPASGSVYVAVESGNDIIASAADSGAWLEESTTAWAFSLFQRAASAMDIREAVRLIPSTHNFFAADNQAFNGVGTDAGAGNIGYQSSGYSRKRQDGSDKLLPLDGTVANPLLVASGAVVSATATTVTSTAGTFPGDLSPDPINFRYDNPTQQGQEFILSIISGTGGKQTRRIAANTTDTVTLEYPWGITPAPGDLFEVYEVVGMPEAMNPAEGYIANWNNKAGTADDGDAFGREHRVTFILERLAADSSWTRDEQRQLNKDLAGLDGRGKYGRHLVPRLREAVDAVGNGGNPAVDTVLAALEAHDGLPDDGRAFNDPLTATTVAGELSFLNSLINSLATTIYGDELAAVGVPTGARAQNLVTHAIDAAAGTPSGAYSQQYSGDYFNGADWRVVVRDALSALATGGIPADSARGNSSYNHPLSDLNSQLSFTPTPVGNRGTYEQIVEAGDDVNGEFIFPLGQSGMIEGELVLPAVVVELDSIDPNVSNFQPIWRDWRFLPMLHVSEDLAGGSEDADGDGVFDGFERWYLGDTAAKATDNSDEDGSDLIDEFLRGSDPTDDDTDDDGLLDGHDGLDQDRLGSAFAKVKGSFKFSNDPAKDSFKLGGKFGTGSLDFDESADTISIRIETESEEVYYGVTIPAGTLIDDGSGLKFSFKDPTGAIGGLGQVSLKLSDDPLKTSSLKLKTAGIDLPGNRQSKRMLLVVTINDASSAISRNIIDERRWVEAGTSLKTGSEPGAYIYN
ncbi:MAG TPA: penicillin acylase family protein [Candidatus Limnocylindrales bacterium]|nr:penicillin acylase family protein [Candidatus Limnocylindrales bacterium]